MKTLIIFACAIYVAFCHRIRSGGLHDVDATTYPKYLKMALDGLGLVSDADVQVLGVQKQVHV